MMSYGLQVLSCQGRCLDSKPLKQLALSSSPQTQALWRGSRVSFHSFSSKELSGKRADLTDRVRARTCACLAFRRGRRREKEGKKEKRGSWTNKIFKVSLWELTSHVSFFFFCFFLLALSLIYVEWVAQLTTTWPILLLLSSFI